MTQLANTAKVSEIIASLQASTGINQKVDLASVLTTKGFPLTGNESMADLITIASNPNLVNTTTAIGATTAQILSAKEGFVNGVKRVGAMPLKNDVNGDGTQTNWHIAKEIAGQSGRVLLRPIPQATLNPIAFNGDMWIEGSDPDFIAANIKSGVNIFGLVGTMPVGIIQKGTAAWTGNRTAIRVNLSFNPDYVLYTTYGKVNASGYASSMMVASRLAEFWLFNGTNSTPISIKSSTSSKTYDSTNSQAQENGNIDLTLITNGFDLIFNSAANPIGNPESTNASWIAIKVG